MKRYTVPSTDIKTFDELVPALAHALCTTERQLYDMVKAEFLNEDLFSQVTMNWWVESCNFSKEKLLEYYTTQDPLVDGLFLWLATTAFCTHLNYIHDSNVWTSRGSEKPDMRDAVILFTEKYFIMVPSVNSKPVKAVVKDGFCNPQDTLHKYVDQPLVLNRPVKNVAQRCLDMDIMTMSMPRPLQCLLAELCGLPVVHYHVHLIGWMQHNISKLLFVQKWCRDRGQSVQMYFDHLEASGHADGLEVLLVSLAMDINISIVQDDIVWASSCEGLCFEDPIIVSTVAGALLCQYCDPEEGNLGDVDTSKTLDSVGEPEVTVPESLKNRPKGGRPLVSLHKHKDTSSSEPTDTNPDDQLGVDEKLKQHPKNPDSGHLSPQTCLICQVKLKSKGALAFHLKHFHREHRPYHCDICMSSFNNKYDLSSHHTNVHAPKAVFCKHCDYKMTSKAQIQLHVRAHTVGIHCGVCAKSFPHKRALAIHSPLHRHCLEFHCTSCSLIFATSNSLNIRVKGKHGPGYVCPCRERFESPAQCARHKKCVHFLYLFTMHLQRVNICDR